MKASELVKGDILTYTPGGVPMVVVGLDPDYVVPRTIHVRDDEDGSYHTFRTEDFINFAGPDGTELENA